MNGRMTGFVAARTLDTYPRGAHRWRLLLLTVLASILGAYEFQLAPLLSLLLPDIHMTTIAYGWFITFAVMISPSPRFMADRSPIAMDEC